MDLFDVLAATWPPEAEQACGPWRLRRGGGGGKRVSAAVLAGPLADPAEAEAGMRDWGQVPLFQLRPEQDAADALLAGRGYARIDPTRFLAAPAADLALGAPDEHCIACDGPLACMVGIWDAGGVGAARRAVMARAAGPRVWLLGRLGDRPVACGFVAVHAEVAMLHAVEVAPEARRAGVGSLLARGAASWALRQGAGTLALAVTEANAPARALYDRLGMKDAGGYHYRIAGETR